MMKQFLCCISLWSLLVVSVANADEWVLKPEVKESTYLFGHARIVLHYDSTQNTLYPKYTLRVYQASELLAQHEDIGFQRLYASPGNAFFLGVSNSGLIEDAYVIFDHHGKIIIRQPHDSGNISYCKMSVSVIRKWYDENNPGVEFNVVDGALREVSINSCNGKRVSLFTGAEGTSQPGHAVDRQ